MTSSALRPRPRETDALAADEIHVWHASLDQPRGRVTELSDGLAADERVRAERYHFDRDRDRFIVARATLRAILGAYLRRAPASLVFRYGAHGKPALTEDGNGSAIRFSVSHSGDEALYAIARDREVGIDIERVRDDISVAEIAGRYFSRREVAALEALPDEARRPAFFRIWTHKEAYIKASGEGLSLPLDGFDISLAGQDGDATIASPSDPSVASRWSVREIPAAAGYASALAAEKGPWRLVSREWPEERSA
jgi:4'-phosphopantetheinyl transferase